MGRLEPPRITARLRLGIGALTLVLLVAVGLLGPAASAQTATAQVAMVESVGMTVSDLDRAVDFYTTVLSFEKLSETEVVGEPYEQLEGVFGLRMRIARLRLG